MPAEPTLGQIMPAAFPIVPRGWHLCDGTLLPIQQNQALFALLGVRFGGDGVRTFGLPDLRGRAVVGGQYRDSSPLSGTATVSLTNAQIPAHTHGLAATTDAGSGRGGVSPLNNVFATNTAGSPAEQIFAAAGSAELQLPQGTNVVTAGGGQSHNNMQPYLAINYLIATSGVFPSRL